MTIARRTKRSTPRFRVPEDHPAVLEVVYPQGAGEPRRFVLRDISISGISFVIPGDLPMPESGSEFNRVRLTLPHTEIFGDLLVMHATPTNPEEIVCGSLFYPASEDDLMKLKGVVAGFEVARSLR